MTSAGETVTTEISIAGANCPWCFNDTLDRLRHEPGVVSVVASIAGQCLRVEHRGVAIDRLLAVVRGRLHADDTTSTEHVMVAIDPHVADLHCTHRHSTNPDRTPDV
ncbi:MAG: hypothetical protein AB7H92_09500 [Microbacteriaceae bacterium]